MIPPSSPKSTAGTPAAYGLLALACAVAACTAPEWAEREADASAPPSVPAEAPDLAAELAGTRWRFVALPGFDLVPDSDPYLELGERVAGSTGCNRFFGSLEIDGDSVAIGALGMTRRYCSPPLDEQEQRIVVLLSSARRIELLRDVLLLWCEEEEEPVRLQRTP
jgi:heat shock protein HslJ